MDYQEFYLKHQEYEAKAEIIATQMEQVLRLDAAKYRGIFKVGYGITFDDAGALVPMDEDTRHDCPDHYQARVPFTQLDLDMDAIEQMGKDRIHSKQEEIKAKEAEKAEKEKEAERLRVIAAEEREKELFLTLKKKYE